MFTVLLQVVNLIALGVTELNQRQRWRNDSIMARGQEFKGGNLKKNELEDYLW
jgi:hypothetical protein